MGQANQQVEPPPSPEVIQQNIELLFGELKDTSQIEKVNDPIIIISRNLSEEGSFTNIAEGFKANPTLLKCLYHPYFQTFIHHLLGLLIAELKNMLQSKMMVLVSRERFRRALNLANFLIFFTNESLIQTVNLLSIRSDLEPITKQLIKEYTKDGN